MRSSALQSLVVAALFASFALATPVADGILVSGDYRLSSNAIEVPTGAHLAHVRASIHVVAANGSVMHVVTPAGRTTSARAKLSHALQSGWITYAFWVKSGNDTPIGSFGTTWTVPPVPATQDSQLLFLFNALEQTSGINITVLQVCFVHSV
jgi:hypothetical protein